MCAHTFDSRTRSYFTKTTLDDTEHWCYFLCVFDSKLGFFSHTFFAVAQCQWLSLHLICPQLNRNRRERKLNLHKKYNIHLVKTSGSATTQTIIYRMAHFVRWRIFGDSILVNIAPRKQRNLFGNHQMRKKAHLNETPSDIKRIRLRAAIFLSSNNIETLNVTQVFDISIDKARIYSVDTFSYLRPTNIVRTWRRFWAAELCVSLNFDILFLTSSQMWTKRESGKYLWNSNK